jgi:SAM-dependent methyltransferase
VVEDVEVRGYHDQSYGDGFADVYDEWYSDITDVGVTTATLAELAAGGPVLELGVGTGRLAVPLAAAGLEVHGLDTSTAMLERMTSKPGGVAVHAHVGDMVDGLPVGPFALIFVAYNTFFSLLTAERQQACFLAIAQRLSPDGCFAIEAFVPEAGDARTSSVTVRSVAADRVVLSVNTSDPGRQLAEGQYVDITEAGGVRLRPWSIRWASPGQLDEMAAAAGLSLTDRWAGFDRSPYSDESERHVSIFRARPPLAE